MAYRTGYVFIRGGRPIRKSQAFTNLQAVTNLYNFIKIRWIGQRNGMHLLTGDLGIGVIQLVKSSYGTKAVLNNITFKLQWIDGSQPRFAVPDFVRRFLSAPEGPHH